MACIKYYVSERNFLYLLFHNIRVSIIINSYFWEEIIIILYLTIETIFHCNHNKHDL